MNRKTLTLEWTGGNSVSGTSYDNPDLDLGFESNVDLYCRDAAKACLAATESNDYDDVCELAEWDTLYCSMHPIVQEYFDEGCCDDYLDAVKHLAAN